VLAAGWIIEPTLGPFVGPFAMISALYALGYLSTGVRMWRRGRANAAGRHRYTGRVVHRETVTGYDSHGDPYDACFLTVDGGRPDAHGWQVERPAYISLPEGTEVSGDVSADRRYLYAITRVAS
jgi:hypothetical protein